MGEEEAGLKSSLRTWKPLRQAQCIACGLDNQVRLSGLPRTEAGIYPAEPRAGRCAKIESWNMQSNFTNYDGFGKYAEKQDQWIYDSSRSLPENKISAYRLEQFDKYATEKQVEHLVMFSYEGLTNSVDVVYYQGNQSRQIWSGHVDTPDEYQEMKSAVNKFIEETKYNSGDK